MNMNASTRNAQQVRQGARLYVRVPRSRATVAAGLTQLNGTPVLLLRRATFDDAPCWVVDPPLRTTLLQAATAPDGRELLPGHQVLLPALPEAWMSARAPSWSTDELAYLREHYGTEPTEAIAAHLGRGLSGTRSKAVDLHLRCRTEWTSELDEIVRLMFPDTAATALQQLLGATAAAIRTRASELGVKKAPGFAATNSREMTLARSLFTGEIAEIIEMLYADTLTDDIAALVGMSKDRVHAYASRRGFKKTKQFMRDAARARSGPDHPMRRHQFAKGHVPANKGRKGVSYPGSEATQFKKGQVPHTWKPIGTQVVNADGYLVQKVSDTGYPPRDWKAVHRLVWLAANGEIPKGHVVRFKDGMKTTDPERIVVGILECITLRENALRNSWHANMPPELRKLVGTRIALSRAINKRQREMSDPT
jgi:hypothetical protein